MTTMISRKDAWMVHARRGKRLAFAVVDYGGETLITKLFDSVRGRNFYVFRLRMLKNGRLRSQGTVTFR